MMCICWYVYAGKCMLECREGDVWLRQEPSRLCVCP